MKILAITFRYFYFLILGLVILFSCDRKDNIYVGYSLDYGIVQIISETSGGYVFQFANQDSTYNIYEDEIVVKEKGLIFNRTIHHKINSNIHLDDAKNRKYLLDKYFLVNQQDTLFLVHNIMFQTQGITSGGTYKSFNIDDLLFIKIGSIIFQVTRKSEHMLTCQNIIDGTVIVLQKINPIAKSFSYEGLLRECDPYPNEIDFLIMTFDLDAQAKPVKTFKIESSMWKETIINNGDTLRLREKHMEQLGHFNYLLIDTILHRIHISKDTLFLEQRELRHEQERCYIMTDL